jgi:hypothetical protein
VNTGDALRVCLTLSVIIFFSATPAHWATADQLPTIVEASQYDIAQSQNISVGKGHQQPADDELTQRGKQLRIAIDKKYRELSANNRLVRNGSVPLTSVPDKAMTDVVMQFIPLKTSFDDAEEILRGAGFLVEPRPGTAPARKTVNRYDVIASIAHYDDRFPGRTDLDVALTPVAPGDYSEVHGLSASIFVSLP